MVSCFAQQISSNFPWNHSCQGPKCCCSSPWFLSTFPPALSLSLPNSCLPGRMQPHQHSSAYWVLFPHFSPAFLHSWLGIFPGRTGLSSTFRVRGSEALPFVHRCEAKAKKNNKSPWNQILPIHYGINTLQSLCANCHQELAFLPMKNKISTGLLPLRGGVLPPGWHKSSCCLWGQLCSESRAAQPEPPSTLLVSNGSTAPLCSGSHFSQLCTAVHTAAVRAAPEGGGRI